MKRVILFVFVLFTVAQTKDTGNISATTVSDSNRSIAGKINAISTNKIDSIKHSGNISVHLEQDKKQSWSDKMPWIAALLIGILTIMANFSTSHFLGKRAKEQLDRQLESSERMNEKQIKATVLSANRQKWIDELREKMTELRTIAGRLHLNLDKKHNGKKLQSDERTKYEIRVEELYHHLRMMVKPDELLTDSEEDKNTRHFLELIDIVKGVCGLGNRDEKQLEQIELIGKSLEDLIACSRRIGKHEWEKVKNLE